LMDRDNEPPKPPKYHAVAESLDARGCTVWTTERKELENYIHQDVIREQYQNYIGTGVGFEDVPTLYAQAVHEASESEATWDEIMADQEKLGKKVSSAKRQLNGKLIDQMSPEMLTQIDNNDEVRTWLRTLGNALSAV
jgi:putative ATP-dependent endonuclease of OLD family